MAEFVSEQVKQLKKENRYKENELDARTWLTASINELDALDVSKFS